MFTAFISMNKLLAAWCCGCTLRANKHWHHHAPVHFCFYQSEQSRCQKAGSSPAASVLYLGCVIVEPDAVKVTKSLWIHKENLWRGKRCIEKNIFKRYSSQINLVAFFPFSFLQVFYVKFLYILLFLIPITLSCNLSNRSSNKFQSLKTLKKISVPTDLD